MRQSKCLGDLNMSSEAFIWLGIQQKNRPEAVGNSTSKPVHGLGGSELSLRRLQVDDGSSQAFKSGKAVEDSSHFPRQS